MYKTIKNRKLLSQAESLTTCDRATFHFGRSKKFLLQKHVLFACKGVIRYSLHLTSREFAVFISNVNQLLITSERSVIITPVYPQKDPLNKSTFKKFKLKFKNETK